jgi:ABC-type Fe3+-siderophore transport system permease subunit
VALGVSALGCVFFAVALWLTLQGRAILGIDVFRASVGIIALIGATISLALELALARREYREEEAEEE